MRPALVVLILALAGCGVKESTEEPGARGPVILRWWDAAALARQAPPTVVTTDHLAETGRQLSALAMTPVRMRHPIAGGTLWLEAPSGSFDRQSGAANRLECQGPVLIHGWVQGRPVCGAADHARVQAGGRELELVNLALVQGGRLTTTPVASLAQGRAKGEGPFLIRPAAPAVLAAMAAVPDLR